MKQEWLAFLSAVQFLTRLPVPDPGWEEGRLDRAAKWFPLVGALVGSIIALTLWLCLTIWNDTLVAVPVTLVVGVLVTGALHEDGLADTADGLGGGRDAAHRLAIMKDSSIGTYGALALILVMLLRFAALWKLSTFFGAITISCIIIAHTISRAAMLPIIWTLPYARDPEDAKVAPLTGTATPQALFVVTLTLAAIIIPPMILVWAILTALVFTLIACQIMRAVMKARLGGWTGDTAGATQIVCEIAFLSGICAWI